jgi:predicted transcriptional regulator
LNNGQDKHNGKRMIHIRLDENTHRELKIFAAKTDQTVQGIVEDLIRNKIDKDQKRIDSIDKTNR